MLGAVYRLVAPRQIEIGFVSNERDDAHVIVRPTHLSICNADQRYYQGKRAPEILEKKLPMALIHEAIGKVVYDPTGTFSVGQRVVMIPNTPTEEDAIIAENYLRSSKFRASGFDGFMQELVSMTPDRLVALPDSVPDAIASFTEIVSVSRHAISRFDRIAHGRREKVGIWGDGNLAFITAVLFHSLFPEVELYIFGIDAQKLSGFTFAAETHHVNHIPADLRIDHAFECVGGNGSPMAIEQTIDHIHPEGTISILGVSENPVPVNTRMILEKGLRMFGSSRSGREDFQNTIDLYDKDPEAVGFMKNLVGEQITVRTIKDMHEAFEADIRKSFGKTIMKWEI